MITPGEITIELLLEPQTYIIVTAISSIILCMISAYVADKFADEAEKEKARALNPGIDTSNIWVLENGDILSILAGFLTSIVFVLPLMNIIDNAGGFFGILSTSVLFGWGARKILPTIANSFVEKRMTEIE